MRDGARRPLSLVWWIGEQIEEEKEVAQRGGARGRGQRELCVCSLCDT